MVQVSKKKKNIRKVPKFIPSNNFRVCSPIIVLFILNGNKIDGRIGKIKMNVDKYNWNIIPLVDNKSTKFNKIPIVSVF